MFLEQFILRFIKLEAGLIFINEVTANKISLKQNKASLSCFNNLKDLLSTIIESEDGHFSFYINMSDATLNIEFIEAEC